MLSLERNELLLQLFFGRHAERSVMTGHLRRHRERLEEGLAAYRQIEQLLRADDSPDMAYWLITLRHGIALVEAGLAWNGDATAILDRQRAT